MTVLEKWAVRWKAFYTRLVMLIELSSWLVSLLPKLGPKGKFSRVPALRLKT